MDGFKHWLDGLGDRIGRFSFNQKVLLGAILAATVISVVIFSVWLQREDQAVLFTNLSPEDAARALDELNKLDVKAVLANGGTTVMVPETMVHRLRIDLASKGIPSTGTVGFEIFDGKQYGWTDFLQNVNYQRALEGELTKSIESLAGIQSARVHLVLPEPSVFKKLQSEPTASVLVRLNPNSGLSESQIRGIQSLVSGSVEGLKTENVTIVDQQSNVLSQGTADDNVGRSEDQLNLKQKVEGYLDAKAESMLAEVLGPGRSIVRVDATLNFEKIDREREIFDPEATVVRSEERGESTDPQSGGTDERSVTNYEINRTVEKIVGQVGTIESLSVAVFVDGKYTVPEGGGDATYTPRSDDELSQIKRIVETAIGLSSDRGDRIEVVNMQFDEHGGETPSRISAPQPGWLGLVWQYGGRILLFCIAATLLFGLKRNLSRLVAEGITSRRELQAGATTHPATPVRGRLGTPGGATQQMAEEVKEYAAENPEKVAEMVQAWIDDSK